MMCRQAVKPGEFTCGDEGCELAALQGQAMLASVVAEQQVAVVRRVRFRPALPSPDIEPGW